ncbi:LysR family transcriptional regulator [Ralstonia pseudosolanacearum]|uniref:LysR family transcriptional regulator n=1 Tax=Ralstonia pseudosolanacearum TaxID=1310165 RepID=UPI001FF7DFAE|nr:LysR family transcriptional regulator [Ralstonia pseudosolanacearum]
MNLRRLEVFVTVATAGSFSAAADRLCIAQSAVSVAIRDLEAELGSKLFVRGARAVALTESGRLLLARSEPALRQLREAAQEVIDLEHLEVGQVRIAAPVVVTQYSLAQPLATFAAKHRGIRLRVVQAGARQIEGLVQRHEVDLGIVADRQFPHELESRLLQELDNVAIVAKSSPLGQNGSLTWRELLQQPLALFPPGYHQRALVEQHAQTLHMRPQVVIEAENPSVLLEAARLGLAATTLPAPAALGVDGVRCVPLPQRQGDRLLVVACWPKAVPLGRAAQALLAHLEQQLRAAPSARTGTGKRDGTDQPRRARRKVPAGDSMS